MARLSPNPRPLCRAFAPMCRVPITSQAIDFAGFVMGVMGVMGFPRTRMGVCAGMCARAQAGGRSRGRVHPITPITPITK